MLIEASLPYHYQSDRNKEITLYALYLSQDRTMLSTTIKSTTIKRYLKVASSIPLKLKQLDPLLDTRSLEVDESKMSSQGSNDRNPC